MSTIIKCSVVLSILLVFATINAKSITSDSSIKIAKRCLKEVGIDRKVVIDIIDTESIPRDGKYGDYLVCTYTLLGFIDPIKSELLTDKIRSFLRGSYTSNEVEFIMDGCKNVQNSVPRQLVLDALDCYTQQFKIANTLHEAGLENVIDTSNTNNNNINPLVVT